MKMKTKKKGFGILALPLAFIVFELAGMIVNHISTAVQTSCLRSDIVDAFPKAEILSVESETGNTTGTGNHVDCLSCITFSSDLSLSEVQEKLSGTYEWNDLGCYVNETDTAGVYCFFLRKRAPFPNNIEGH